MPKEQESLTEKTNDSLINSLNKIVLFIVRILAVLMVFVIFWALADVLMHLYKQALAPYESIFNIENLFSTLGAFLAVLIAIEVFLNILFYLKRDAIHVPLVLATALTAIARKVIVVDYATVPDAHMYATAALILSVGVTYWLVTRKD